MKCCEKLSEWLGETGFTKLLKCYKRDRRLPSEIEKDADMMRLLSDCYMCFYTCVETVV